MIRKEITKNPKPKDLEKAVETLKNGGIVVYPTDTVYGLAVDALNVEAIGKLFILKRRAQKPLPIITHSLAEVKAIAEVSPRQEQIMKKYWPGAVTFVLKKKPIIPNALTLGLETIGVRIPSSKVPLMLARLLGRPITSTSANLSGEKIGTTVDEIYRQFQSVERQPDYYLDEGELDAQEPSTVVDLTGSKPKVLRKGPVSVS